MRGIKRTLKALLGLERVAILGMELVEGLGVVVRVKPTGKPRCPKCRRTRPGYDRRRARRWRHVDIWGRRCYLEAVVRRVDCPTCGVMSEAVSWASPGGEFTHAFQNWVTWFTQRCDKTMVAALSAIAWRTVGRIVERVMARVLPPVDWAKVRAIGVDELSYRKGHRYITLVTDLDTGRVIWSHEGKNAEALANFFHSLDRRTRRQIRYVTMDMSGAYAKAVRDHLPLAQIVYDRFHVEKMANEALDKTRRAEWRVNQGTPVGQAIKHTRWALLKAPWNLSPKQEGVLASLQERNKRLYRAYLLKESLAGIFRALPEVDEAVKDMRQWLAWASRSRLPAFAKLGRTIRSHFEGVLAYFETGFTNGLAEGINNKARLATRQAYGLHRAKSVIAMIELRCTGIHLPAPCGR